jgi:hypothetical protein
MDNVTYLDQEQSDGTIVTFAIIDHGNGEFTSMPKSMYDAQQAEKFTPILPE